MSVDGILIDAPGAAPIGTELELEIDWPGLYHGKPMVRLLVIGSVVRNDGRGTAVRILSHKFRHIRPAAVPARLRYSRIEDYRYSRWRPVFGHHGPEMTTGWR